MLEVELTPGFKCHAKRLTKKYASLAAEIRALVGSLASDPTQGTLLMPNCYKIRLAIKSKGRGKSGGARVITTVFVDEEIVYLLDIYDKSEQSSISKAQLTAMLETLGDTNNDAVGGESRQ